MHPDFEQIQGPVDEYFGPVRVPVGYPLLVATFGEPNSSDDPSKTDVAWDVKSPVGAVHIYNYKNGPAYTGRGRVEDIVGFSFQGTSETAINAAREALDNTIPGYGVI